MPTNSTRTTQTATKQEGNYKEDIAQVSEDLLVQLQGNCVQSFKGELHKREKLEDMQGSAENT